MMTPIIVKEIASPKMVLSSVVKKNIKNTKYQSLLISSPVGKIAEKAVCKSVNLSAELIKTHSFRLFFR